MKDDLEMFDGRRAALKALAGLGLALVHCGTSAMDSDAAATGGDTGAGSDATGDATSGCSVVPDETSGPYPDTMGLISHAAFNRRDITEGKTGIPLTLTLTVVDVNNGCAPLANADIEVWHCDAGGVYSEYANAMNAGSTTTTYLRGIQTTDANGQVTFATIYPGWYLPRATHIHVEVFAAGNTTTPIKTTQLAFPEAVSAAVYATSAYVAHGQNATTNAGDMVFSDGATYELVSIAGSTRSGYVATLVIGVTT